MTEPLHRVPISKRLVVINSLSNVATRVLTVGVFAWVIRHLIQRVSQEDLALLVVVWAITVILPILQSVLTAGLARYVTEAYAGNNLDRVTQITTSVFPFLLLCGSIVAVVAGLAIWKIGPLLAIPEHQIDAMRFMLVLVVGRLVVGFWMAPFNTGFFVKQRFVLQNLLLIGGSLLRIALMIGLIFGIGPKVEWVILAQVVSQLTVLFVSTAISMRLVPELRLRRGYFDFRTTKELANFGGWYSVAQLAGTIRRSADPLILHLLATPVAVNSFFYGEFVDMQVRQLHRVGGQALLPALTAMHARGEKFRLAAAFLRQGRLSLWIMLLIATPIFLFRTELFRWYLGDQFQYHHDAPTVLALLIGCYPFAYPISMLGPAAHAMGEIGQLAWRAIVIQLVNVALTLLLVGHFGLGAVGSALATFCVAATFTPTVYYPLAVRLLDLKWSELFSVTIVPGLVPALIAATLGIVLRESLAPESFGAVTLTALAVVFVYIFAVWLCMTPVDRRDLAGVARLSG